MLKADMKGGDMTAKRLPSPLYLRLFEIGRELGSKYDHRPLRGWMAEELVFSGRYPPEAEHDQVADLFFVAGFEGWVLPEWARGWRFGKLPAGGRSRNSRDDYAEPGVSLMGLLTGGRYVNEATGALTGLYVSGRAAYVVDGWLHHKSGSDGEPIVVGAKIARCLSRGDAHKALRRFVGA